MKKVLAFIMTAVMALTAVTLTASAAGAKLPAPTTVKAAVKSYSQVSLAWNKVTGAEKYAVYYLKPGEKNYTQFGITSNLSAAVTGLKGSTSYSFKIMPLDITGGVTTNGNASKAVSAKTAKAPVPNSPLDFKYTVEGDGIVLTKYVGTRTDVMIPEKINGKPVVSVGGFSGSKITSVILPNSVTSINTSAFYGCISLTSINIPNGVTSIGERAFAVCDSLRNITVPGSVEKISGGMFYKCKSLKSVVIQNGVKSIENASKVLIMQGGELGSFGECTSLKSVTLPKSITRIGKYAFSGCSSLTNVVIPNGVTDIDRGAFENCTSIKNVTIPGSVDNINCEAFYGCSSLTSVTIQNGVKSIAEQFTSGIPYGTFENCKSLKSVTIPNSVTRIDRNAFYNCPSLNNATKLRVQSINPQAEF